MLQSVHCTFLDFNIFQAFRKPGGRNFLARPQLAIEIWGNKNSFKDTRLDMHISILKRLFIYYTTDTDIAVLYSNLDLWLKATKTQSSPPESIKPPPLRNSDVSGVTTSWAGLSRNLVKSFQSMLPHWAGESWDPVFTTFHQLL